MIPWHSAGRRLRRELASSSLSLETNEDSTDLMSAGFLVTFITSSLNTWLQSKVATGRRWLVKDGLLDITVVVLMGAQ